MAAAAAMFKGPGEKSTFRGMDLSMPTKVDFSSFLSLFF